jgi:hypothetical protein
MNEYAMTDIQELAEQMNALSMKLDGEPVMKHLVSDDPQAMMKAVDAAIDRLSEKLEKLEASKWVQAVEEIKERDGCSYLSAMSRARVEEPSLFKSYNAQTDVLLKAAQKDDDADEEDEPDDDEDEEDSTKAAAPRDPEEEPDDDSDPRAQDPGRGFLEAVEQIMTARGVSRTAAMTLARKEEPALFQQYQRYSSTTRLHTAKAAPKEDRLGRGFLELLARAKREQPRVKADVLMSQIRRAHPEVYAAFQASK